MRRALVLLSILSLLLAAPLQLWADAQGPNNGGTFANLNYAGGSVNWTSPANAQTSNNSYASASLAAEATTNYLKATNFGFSITGAVEGIEVNLERKASAAGWVVDAVVKLVKGGAVVGGNKALGGTWPNSDAYASHGGSSDLWSETWAIADINASDFGVVVAARNDDISTTRTAYIDHIEITVTFTAPQSKLLITQTRRAAAFQLASVPGGRRIRPMKSIYSYILFQVPVEAN